jgi:hypothetical protein
MQTAFFLLRAMAPEQRQPDVLFQPSNTENNGVSGCNAVRCS